MPQLVKITYFYPACERLAPDRKRNLQRSPDHRPGFFDFMQTVFAIIANLGSSIPARFAIFNNMARSILAIIANLGAVAVLKFANDQAQQNWFAL